MEIYEALKKDHAEVKELLNELINLNEKDEYRFVLIEEIRNALIPHARAEESVFYNTIRAVDVDKTIVLHGYKEHLEAETLLRTLQVQDKLDFSWKGTARKLQDALLHHIQEEEQEIFASAKNIFTKEEAVQMGEAFEKLKPEILKEGFLKTTVDMVVNMLPPRLAQGLRNFNSGSQSGRDAH